MGDGAEGPHGARVILLGPPGAGKGTQAEVLCQRLSVCAISTGEMLREAVAAGSELGVRVREIMAAGALVDDATMAEVVRDRLARQDARNGFLLDGYPRTLPQAETLAGILRDAGLSLDAVLLVEVPEDELVRRTLLRGRADDKEEVVRERLRVYARSTQPIVEYYHPRPTFRSVDGDQTLDSVAADIAAAVASVVGSRR